MKYNREKHKRRSVRLTGYDYSGPGAYFVTICAWNRECLFGDVVEGLVVLNEYGRVVKQEWLRTGDIRQNVEIDEFIIMPNHFHGILVINYHMNDLRRDMFRRGVLQYAPTGVRLRSPTQTIGAIIRGFKAAVTRQINLIRNTPGLPVWQRNYFERVIRNEKELFRIRDYICVNPVQWDMDEENPANLKKDDK